MSTIDVEADARFEDAEPTGNPAPNPGAVAVRKQQPAGEVATVAQEPSRSAMTPAQAKVDAIAGLTMSAYARAATLTLSDDEIKALEADFPDEAFCKGAAGKDNLIYIQHAWLRARLNQVFRPGQWAIVPRNRWAEPFQTQRGVDGSRVYVEAMLLVRGAFVAEAIGEMEYYPSNAAQNYGDAVEGAKTAALRRCCKELGVGLQAWRKEWCEQWWKRNPSGVVRPAAAQPAPVAHITQPAPVAAKPAPAPAPAQPAAPVAANLVSAKPAMPTEKTRQWALMELQKAGFDPDTTVAEFLQKAGAIMPNENCLDWPLDQVPADRQQLAMLLSALHAFMNGEQAGLPYRRHGALELTPPPTRTEPAPAQPVPEPKPEAPAAAGDESWRNVIVTVPRKGMTRKEYLQNPDTIGSLYDARHGNDDESAASRTRLFGLVTRWQPAPWKKTTGEEVPPSAADIQLRKALDAFDAWYKANHPGEKI